jgi:hypothetical protein
MKKTAVLCEFLSRQDSKSGAKCKLGRRFFGEIVKRHVPMPLALIAE